MDLAARGVSPESSSTEIIAHHPYLSLPSSTGEPSFPIIAVAIVGILATASLLVSYYVLVIKCCLNSRRHSHDAAERGGGLEESAIRSIPVFRYKKRDSSAGGGECAVCLGEYREGDNLRLIPACLHSFHIDCIDVWLHTSPNCPLCRSSVSPAAPPPPIFPVVVEIRKGRRKMSMGDECIVAGRDRDETFSVEPIRRSFSMDSCGDRRALMAIKEALRRHCGDGVVDPDGNARSLRRSFFSFRNGSRGASGTSSAVLPVYLEP